MKKKFFLLIAIAALLFACGAFADDTVGVFVPVPEMPVITELAEPEWPEPNTATFETMKKMEDNFVGGFGFDDESDTTSEETSSSASPQENSDALFNSQKPIKVITESSADISPISLDFSQKNTTPPAFPAHPVAPQTNRRSILDMGAGSVSTRAETGPGTGPNTAPHFPVNSGYYPGTLSGTGAQHWFYTQAPSSGQLTVHLDVPATTAIDYDLNVYSYEPSTGTLYYFMSSAVAAGSPEHISFAASAGAYYFIHIQSYQGGSTTMPYTLHVEMAARGTGEIDDLPTQARTIPLNTNGLSGALSMRNDWDFMKFTASGNRSLIELQLQNTNMIADIHALNGSTIGPGLRLDNGYNDLATTAGATYYIRFYHGDNTAGGLTSGYAVRINSFNCYDRIAAILGRQSDNSRIAFVTNSDSLYVNSTCVFERLAQSASYSYDRNTGVYWYRHESYSSSPVREVLFLSYYSTTRNDVDSMSDALALYVYRGTFGSGYDMGVHYENRYSRYDDNVSGWNTWFENGYADGYYIVDLSDNTVKDFKSSGLGFYNGFFETGDWVYPWIVR